MYLKGELFMKNNKFDIIRVGNFVVHYPQNRRHVAVSIMGQLGTMSTQLLTHEKVRGVLSPTGTYCNLPFDGVVYPGIYFKKPLFMSQRKLERFLKKVS